MNHWRALWMSLRWGLPRFGFWQVPFPIPSFRALILNFYCYNSLWDIFGWVCLLFCCLVGLPIFVNLKLLEFNRYAVAVVLYPSNFFSCTPQAAYLLAVSLLGCHTRTRRNIV